MSYFRISRFIVIIRILITAGLHHTKDTLSPDGKGKALLSNSGITLKSGSNEKA